MLVADTLLASVTTARYSGEPAVAKLLRVKVVVLAPATPLPLLRLVNVTPLFVETCHCTVSGAVPSLSVMVKNSKLVWPTVAVAFCACVVIEGAALMVTVAALLAAVAPLPSVTTARNSGEPAVVKPLRVRVVVVAPAIVGPLLRLVNETPLFVEICHW